jgi:hypothetical protein
MQRAEDFRQQLGVVRTPFQCGLSPLHAVQTLLALNQEFARQLVHLRFIGRRVEKLEKF